MRVQATIGVNVRGKRKEKTVSDQREILRRFGGAGQVRDQSACPTDQDSTAKTSGGTREPEDFTKKAQAP